MAEEARAGSPEAAAAAEIVGDLVDIWLRGLRRTYERARDPEATWEMADVANATAEVVEQLMPVVERSIDLGLAYLRPWSQAFTTRVQRAD